MFLYLARDENVSLQSDPYVGRRKEEGGMGEEGRGGERKERRREEPKYILKGDEVGKKKSGLSGFRAGEGEGRLQLFRREDGREE
jgi:intein/homing endonuclease